MIAKILAIARIAVVTAGIAIAFYWLFGGSPATAIHVVAFTTVGLVGVISFASHVIFYKSDAARLGWSSDHPAFQFEVGFANLAFALTAFMAFFWNWGEIAETVIVLGFALYLFQGMLFFIWRVVNEKKPRLWFNVGSFFLFSGMMLVFVIAALSDAGLLPFSH
jgi:hypothetical protein